jgi:hypothetical protein
MTYAYEDDLADDANPYGEFENPAGVYDDSLRPQAEPEDGGLPADVLASLQIPGRPDVDGPPVDAVVRPDQKLIDGFRWHDVRGGWVDFGSVFEITGALRREIVTKVTTVARRAADGKAGIAEQVAVDADVTWRLLAAVVEDWSYEKVPLPITSKTLDLLPGIVVDGMSNVGAEYMKMIMTRAGGNEGSETNPASPQQPSAG